jgi:outer membrane lipoprotein
MKTTLISFLVLISFLNACTTTSKLNQRTTASASIAELQTLRSIGNEVRWGGEVVKVHNYSDHTLIEIVARKLWRSGTPTISDSSEGRFLAKVDSFTEPENLKAGRQITITGAVEDWKTQKIGEYDYLYPLVAAAQHKVWPKQRAHQGHYHDPCWNDWGSRYGFGARNHHYNYFSVRSHHWIH